MWAHTASFRIIRALACVTPKWIPESPRRALLDELEKPKLPAVYFGASLVRFTCESPKQREAQPMLSRHRLSFVM